MGGGRSSGCRVSARSLLEAGRGPGPHMLWGALSSMAVSAFAFHWLLPTIAIYGHMSHLAALPLFLLHAVVFQLKLPFALALMELLRRHAGVPALWSGTLCATVTDIFVPQLFPWFWGNLVGTGTLVNQPAALFGVGGLSFLLFLAAGLLLAGTRVALRPILRRRGALRTIKRLSRHTRLSLALALSVLFAAGSFSMARLADRPALLSGAPVRITIVQPNTGRGLNRFKEDREFAAAAVNSVFNMALAGLVRARGTTDLLILPESAIPFHGTRDTKENEGIYSPTFHSVVAFLARYGKTDVLYNELDRKDGRLRNAAVVFSREGRHGDSYFKQKLLPFGEYLPGESWLPLRRLLPEASNYAAGETGRLLHYGISPGRSAVNLALPDAGLLQLFGRPQEILRDWPHGPAEEHGSLAPLICYEGLFPALVRDLVRLPARTGPSGPDFLVNLSNDAWFGDTLENYQHAGAARLRAIETGRYFVRATLSGSSSVYDPLGRPMLLPTRAGTEAVHTVTVMRRPNASTLYLRFGDSGSLLLCCLALAVGFRGRRRLGSA